MGELWIVPWFSIEGTPEALDSFMKEMETFLRNELDGTSEDEIPFSY